jgi:hypothetical protein
MRIIVSGHIGRSGLGGQAWANLQYLIGLRELGHDVYYLEDCGETSSVWNWEAQEWTQDIGFPAAYVRDSLEPFGFADRWLYRTDSDHAGIPLERFRSLCKEADLLIMRGIPLWDWRSEYDGPKRRAFIDVDPGFTQIRIAEGDEALAKCIRRADHLFTIAQRFGAADCPVAIKGWEWHAILPPVALSAWPFVMDAEDAPATHFTSVMRWRGFGNVKVDGVSYGEKDVEFKQFVEMPRLTGSRFRIAINGPDDLRAHGWELVPGEVATRTPAAYKRFIQRSRGEFGVAKQVYVKTCGGWFSDRTVCYLASGRPALLQDTGLGDWLRVGEGVVVFSDLKGAISGLEAINANYDKHRRAARDLAEEYFSASRVLPQMLEIAMK